LLISKFDLLVYKYSTIFCLKGSEGHDTHKAQREMGVPRVGFGGGKLLFSHHVLLVPN